MTVLLEYLVKVLYINQWASVIQTNSLIWTLLPNFRNKGVRITEDALYIHQLIQLWLFKHSCTHTYTTQVHWQIPGLVTHRGLYHESGYLPLDLKLHTTEVWKPITKIPGATHGFPIKLMLQHTHTRLQVMHVHATFIWLDYKKYRLGLSFIL